MRAVTEITPLEDTFELVRVPAARVIGNEARCGGALGNTAPALAERTVTPPTWDRLVALGPVVDGGVGWTCEWDPATETFTMLIGVVVPPGTPVPEGFTHRDVAAATCAKGLLGEDVPATVERARESGYVPDWGRHPWNAELYLTAEQHLEPANGAEPMHWLVPVAPVAD